MLVYVLKIFKKIFHLKSHNYIFHELKFIKYLRQTDAKLVKSIQCC